MCQKCTESANTLAESEAGRCEAPPVRLGAGEYTYEVLPSWGVVPSGIRMGDASSVCVDSRDNVHVLTRGSHPVVVFDPAGRFLHAWGEDLGFANPHGMSIGPDDSIYITDDVGACVRKFSTTGRPLLEISMYGAEAAPFSGDPFSRCTHTALSPQGEIYVSDGYRNARVHKYSPDGRLLTSWGEPGTDPGQFNLVHNICCDAEGWVYVADRENRRIQVFDGAGRFEAQLINLARPCGLALSPGADPFLAIGELGPATYGSTTALAPRVGPRVTLMTRKGHVLARLGEQPIGEAAGQFIAPHGIAVDSCGDIYVAEVANSYWPSLFGAQPAHELRSFQKLVRVASAGRVA